jgi:hypothetical protein
MVVAALALLGYGSFVVVSLVVGVRLLRLWRRTRETPELAIAVALIAGAIAYAVGIAAFSIPTLPRAGAALIETTAGFFAHLGSASLALALRHIFQPEARWARVLQISFTVALAGAFTLRLADPLAFPPPDLVFWPYSTIAASVYAWSVIESLRCYRQMARRARIGLADPEAARRFLLWAVAGGSALGIFVVVMLDRVGESGNMSSWTVLLSSAFGIVASIGISFAFFPGRRSAETEAGAPG